MNLDRVQLELCKPTEALGFADAHDRHGVGAGADVGQAARLFQALELVEEDRGVFEVDLGFDAGRAAEREPDALDALAQAISASTPGRETAD